MSAVSPTKKTQRSGWWFPALVLLWSEYIFWQARHREELLTRLGEVFTLVGFIWFSVGIGFLIWGTMRRDKWVLVALLVSPVGFLQAGLMDDHAYATQRWQAIRPTLEAQLAEVMKVPLAPNPRNYYAVKVLKPGIRVVVNSEGHRLVSFIQYRIGIDNGLAYVYSPSDSLPSTGLGYELSGFGEIARIEPLGNHWYRCYFT